MYNDSSNEKEGDFSPEAPFSEDEEEEVVHRNATTISSGYPTTSPTTPQHASASATELHQQSSSKADQKQCSLEMDVEELDDLCNDDDSMLPDSSEPDTRCWAPKRKTRAEREAESASISSTSSSSSLLPFDDNDDVSSLSSNSCRTNSGRRGSLCDNVSFHHSSSASSSSFHFSTASSSSITTTTKSSSASSSPSTSPNSVHYLSSSHPPSSRIPKPARRRLFPEE